ncbi:MAG: transglutaminase-like domain-containing protein [Myxococcota bacterium]|nr:transglutaminase-like domain-containing protein [Myxococcota bacterium]
MTSFKVEFVYNAAMQNTTRWDLFGLVGLAVFAGVLYWSSIQTPSDTSNLKQDILDQGTEVRLGHEWMGLYFQEKRVGYFHIHKTAAKPGVDYRVVGKIQQLGLLNKKLSIEIKLSASLDESMTLTRFQFELDAGPASITGRGVVVGQQLKLAITTAGVTRQDSLKLKSTPVLRETLGPRLAKLALTPGAVHTMSIFDPITQRNQRVTITVEGYEDVVVVDRLVKATRIRQSLNGMTLHAWINQRGEMLRQELGFGMVAVRETKLQATAPIDDVSFIEQTMINAPGMPKKADELNTLTLRLGGTELAGFNLDDRRQVFDDGLLKVTKEQSSTGLQLPARPERAADLESTLLIQSDSDEIREQATDAVGPSTDSIGAAKALMEWVSNQVEDAPVIGVPSALETLKTRRGDCNEHTTLFVAMARSIGIPTRFVTGIAFLNGRFGYHAWAEVLTKEGWLSVDPTWGQMPVDVGHIAFVRGGLSRQASLVQLMGQLTLSVVEYR